MFTQKKIAQAFGVTTKAINTALRGYGSTFEEVVQIEGARSVRRSVRVYQQSDVFALASRGGKLLHYEEMCKSHGVAPHIFHVTRKEVAFGEMLRRFLPDDVGLLPQHQIRGYRIDFYLPAFRIGIEYDERHHRRGKRSERDAMRQDAIQDAANIRFVRVQEGAEESGLFLIAKAMLTNP